MSEQAQRVRIVLVSPGDVAKERAAVQAVVEELNRTVAADRGLVLSLWRWETDAHPAMSFDGPQGVIDELMDIEHAIWWSECSGSALALQPGRRTPVPSTSCAGRGRRGGSEAARR